MQRQDGVISRSQAEQCDATPADLPRLVRRREWARVHPGVFVNHTGPLTWQQRARAATLYAAPAERCAASRRCAAANGPGHRGHDEGGTDPGSRWIASRTVIVPRGRWGCTGWSTSRSRAQWNLAPPRLRIEEAVLDVGAADARG